MCCVRPKMHTHFRKHFVFKWHRHRECWRIVCLSPLHKSRNTQVALDLFASRLFLSKSESCGLQYVGLSTQTRALWNARALGNAHRPQTLDFMPCSLRHVMTGIPDISWTSQLFPCKSVASKLLRSGIPVVNVRKERVVFTCSVHLHTTLSHNSPSSLTC